jgi:hypothetical protein
MVDVTSTGWWSDHQCKLPLDSTRVTIGADQLEPLSEVEPPGPGPWCGVHHPKRSIARVLDRIGQVRVAWSEQIGPDAGPEVPDERPGAGAQPARPGRPLAARPPPGRVTRPSSPRTRSGCRAAAETARHGPAGHLWPAHRSTASSDSTAMATAIPSPSRPIQWPPYTV